jgi:hypothetical protein
MTFPGRYVRAMDNRSTQVPFGGARGGVRE